MKLGIKVFAGTVYSKLHNLPEDVNREMTKTYQDDVGPLLVNTARPIAPVKTGAYRAGISYSVQPGTNSPPGMVFGSKVRYSGNVEQRHKTIQTAIAASWTRVERLVSQAIRRGLDKDT